MLRSGWVRHWMRGGFGAALGVAFLLASPAGAIPQFTPNSNSFLHTADSGESGTTYNTGANGATGGQITYSDVTEVLSITGVITDSQGCLGGVAATPIGTMDQIAHLRLADSVHVLHRETHLTHRIAALLFNQEPQPVPIALVPSQLALDPGVRAGVPDLLRIEAHDFGIRQHLGDEGSIVEAHFPESEAGCLEERHLPQGSCGLTS